MADNIASYVLEGVANLIEQAGQDPVTIARQVGLNPAALYQSDILISELKVNDLFEEAAKVCGDRFFGLKIAQIKGLDMLGPLWLLARNADTVGDVISLVAENMAVHSQGLSVTLENESESGVSLVFEIVRLKLGAFQAAPRNTAITQMIEVCLAAIGKELRGSLGRGWVPQYVQFRYAAPTDTQPLHKVFGEHLFFNQDVNAIRLSRADIQTPNFRNPLNKVSTEAQGIARRELESSVGQSMSFVQRVARIIRTLINDQGVSAGEVASTLNIPLRTLQYRNDRAREELARHYLEKSELPVSAIAERLHFTDTAALSNFFKSRVGVSPRDYVKRLRG